MGKKTKTAAEKAVKEAKKANVELRHISELGKVDREVLEAILRKEPEGLDEAEMATLTARRAYLNSDERKKYGV